MYITNMERNLMNEENQTQKAGDHTGIDQDQFRKEYKQLETWGDANRLLRKMNKDQLKVFIESHEQVNKLTGLDMRQEFILGSAKVIFQHEFHPCYTCEEYEEVGNSKFCIHCLSCNKVKEEE